MSSSLSPLPRILVVDDEPMIHEVFRLAFDGTHEVDGALNGIEALAAAERHSYAVAIVDLLMEGMSGVEVLTALKQASPHIQMLIFTGYATMDSAIAAVNTGAFRYLQKPFRLKEMKQCVADAFARYEAEIKRAPDPGPEALAEVGLVGRKAEIALHVMDYKSTKEIATALQLSPRTVEKHLETVFAILGISSRREMIGKLKNIVRGAALFVIGTAGQFIAEMIE